MLSEERRGYNKKKYYQLTKLNFYSIKIYVTV
jgi:hypothetical protein